MANTENLTYLGIVQLKNGKIVGLYADYSSYYPQYYRKQNGRFIHTWLPWQNEKKSPISHFLIDHNGNQIYPI